MSTYSINTMDKEKHLKAIRTAREERIIKRCQQLNEDESAYWFTMVYNTYFDDICGGGKITKHTMKWFSDKGLTMIENDLQLKPLKN